MIYLVVGLSGVGKSAYCEAATERLPGVEHVELDERIDSSLKDGLHWPQFFETCKAKIQELEANLNGTLLVDIGAGFFKAAPTCFDFLRPRKDVIAIYDEPDNIFARVMLRPTGPWRNSNVEFYRRELTQDWQNLFSKAPHRLDIIGFSENQAKDAFVKLVGQLIAK